MQGSEANPPGDAERPLRVAVLSELPTPYRWPLFERLGRRAGLDLTVFFYARTEADRDWGLDVGNDVGHDAGKDGTTDGTRVVFLAGKAIPVRGKRSLFFHWNPDIVRHLAAGQFDVVVVPGWSMPTTWRTILWCRLHRVPYVLFSETHARSARPWWLRAVKRVLLRPLIGGARAWLATGTWSEEFLAAHGAVRDRTFRFANTPDVEAFATRVDAARDQRAATRATWGLPEDALVALFVGRLIGVKDVRTVLAAHATLRAEHPRLWLLVIGDGSEGPDLRAEFEGEGVVFTGALRPDALPAQFAAADLFVLPSVHEPWGVVVNEAMAAGLPVVLSDRVGAGGDLLQDGRNGRAVPCGDVPAWRTALQEYLREPERCRAHGAESRRIVAGWGYGPSVEGFEQAVRSAAGRADTRAS